MFSKGIFCISFLSILFMPSAHAYIDPGTGSMLLQIIAACGVAALVFGKNVIGWIRALFMRRDAGDESDHGK